MFTRAVLPVTVALVRTRLPLFITSESLTQLASVTKSEREMERRAQAFRSGLPPLDVTGKTVILVDDGLATGATAAAAIKSIRRGNPRTLVFAVPVGARESVAALSKEVDELVCLETPAEFRAVGEWYQNFSQTGDQRVIDLLRRAAALRPVSEAP